ncbi:MAG: hypothetical protein QXZ37_03145 [Sulfolobales archaeon]
MKDELCYELYGEYISLKELGMSVFISTAFAMLFFFLAPAVSAVLGVQSAGISITLGALGATVGFTISVLVSKVKRVVVEV